jgi:hypothetical protein
MVNFMLRSLYAVGRVSGTLGGVFVGTRGGSVVLTKRNICATEGEGNAVFQPIANHFID